MTAMAPWSLQAARPQHVTCCSDHSRHRHAAPMAAAPKQHQQGKRALISAVLPQLFSLVLAGVWQGCQCQFGALTLRVQRQRCYIVSALEEHSLFLDFCRAAPGK